MKPIQTWRTTGILMLLGFVFGTTSTSFALFETITKFVKERKEISAHSRNVAGAVKALYRDRKSIQAFSQSASVLVQAYRGLVNKASNIPKLLDIARAIATLVSEYSSLAPKTTALYKSIKPDMAYFSTLKDSSDDQEVALGTTGKKFLMKSFSENRIGKLAGAAGWARVWGAVSDSPMNLFRWGKLSDEYKLGKTEGTYALKTAQIAFETESYFEQAKASMQDLLGIRGEINGILNGDLGALLGIGDTLSKVQGAAGSAQVLGDTLTSAVNHMGKRFDELNKIQDAYVKVHQDYVQKYGSPTVQTPYSSGQATSSSGSYPTTSTPGVSYTDPVNPTRTGGATKDLQSAMAMYQKAYQEYIRITQDPETSQSSRTKAINNLQKARNLVETLKANASR